MNEGEDSEPAPGEPPSAEQVARRALVLATVCCRGILELDGADPGAADFWKRASAWWTSLSLESELEQTNLPCLLENLSAELVSRLDPDVRRWRSEPRR